MTERFLHIVSFDIPYPPDYGGVIDVYYKLLALKREGIRVILHCFEYRIPPSEKLNAVCDRVYYYKRKSGIRYFLSGLPYIVNTRSEKKLLENLCGDQHPILFEGLHCCYFLGHKKLKDRIKAVRMHNIEQDYYRGLSRSEQNVFKKFYFQTESRKLEKFEPVLRHASSIAAISEADMEQLQKRYLATALLPPFHPFEKADIREGTGKYALYHGNLSVPENSNAAMLLVKNVFAGTGIPLFIAGKNAPAGLKKEVLKYPEVQLRTISNDGELYNLVRNAQVNVLPAIQRSGIRLKLVTALYLGRHCVVNPEMAEGSGLEDLFEIAQDPRQMKLIIQNIFNTPFTKDRIRDRESKLEERLSTRFSAQTLVRLLGLNR